MVGFLRNYDEHQATSSQALAFRLTSISELEL